MGLYDREYYREEYSRWERWQFGPVTIGLVLATTLPMFFQFATADSERYGAAGDPLLFWGGFSMEKILDGEVWRLLTSVFLHHPQGSLWVLGGGVLILLFCGRAIETTYGPKEMFWFYVVSILATQCGLLVVSLTKPFRFAPQEYMYGCSGPTVAVLVLFARLSQNTKVPLLFTEVKAGQLATAVVLFNVALYFLSGGNYFAAVPVLLGAAFGYAYHAFSWRVSNWLPGWSGGRSAVKRSPVKSRPLFQPMERDEDPTPVTAPVMPAMANAASSPLDEQLEAKLDQVLAKVAIVGKSGLSAEETAILLQASEIYKRRRK